MIVCDGEIATSQLLGLNSIDGVIKMVCQRHCNFSEGIQWVSSIRNWDFQDLGSFHTDP